MPTFSLNSKKCLALSLWLAIPFASASTPPVTTESLIKKEISALAPGKPFTSLLSSWETRYGAQAVPSLLKIASDSRQQDSERYIAVMGAARLGGTQMAPLLLPLLKDRSWMIRCATLRALRALRHPESGTQILPLLKDPALVVRSEAVDAVALLRPVGASDALMANLEDSASFAGGKAQMGTRKALSALTEILKAEKNPTSSLVRLEKISESAPDPEFRKTAAMALKNLSSH